LLDGDPVCSCLVLLGSVADRAVTTVEGIHDGQGGLHPIQRAMAAEGAVQCGFCTPGVVVTASALLARGEPLGPDAIRRGLSGNLCRCTGYAKIVQAVERAAGDPAAAGTPPRKEAP
jgi:aerobic-type carbon monoxide dehydrogenase small subunit (CoxS/CutS family)